MEPFQIMLALGVLHHLEDYEVRQLFALAQAALREGGRLITILTGLWSTKYKLHSSASPVSVDINP